MDRKEIIAKVDHTELKQTAGFDSIKTLCDDGVRFGAASVCIPPCYVAGAVEYLQGKLPVCTVIGFPNGYNSTAVKVFETQEAVKDGAKEIDMVINLGYAKSGLFDKVTQEIKAVRQACKGCILKVIVETCFLTEEEKVRMCKCVADGGADFIKTSTGFGGGGATFEDVKLFKENIPAGLKIKAAGGIKSFEDAQKFIECGADRLGTSRLIGICKSE